MGVSTGNWRKRQNHYSKVIPTNMKNGLRHGFRSGLEQKNAKFLESVGANFLFEKVKIPYEVPLTRRKYTPDFLLDNGIFIETKGKLEPKDRAKHLFIQSQHPELDIRFVFQRPYDKIYKGSPTTYAMWADKYGFKWASMTIPKSWILEEGPEVKPDQALKGTKK